MRVTWTPTPELRAFQAEVSPWLLQHELINSQLLGVMANAVSGLYDTCWTLQARDEADQLQLVAIRTPPRGLLVSRAGDARASAALADALHARQVTLPGVFGPAESAAAFADAWCALDPARRITGRDGLILYRCDALIPPEPVPGAARSSRAEDALLMIPWARAFERDVGDPPAADTEARVSHLCAAGDMFIWEVDDVPVSCAAIVRRAAHTASIGYVYTPRAARRRGFAAAVTAAVTKRLLDAGLPYTNLFTAATNATTNHIYPSIGYTRVSDYLDVAFGPR